MPSPATEYAIAPTSGTGVRAQPGAPVDPATLMSGVVSPSEPGLPSQGPLAGPLDPTTSGAPEPGTGSSGSSSSSGGSSTPSPNATDNGSMSSNAGADAFASTAGQSFLSLLQNAASPDALEAQNIILRRIALQGDVIPSRVPAPLNITQIGGYINLLTNLNELDMRSQVLAGILGVAGPNPPLGWVTSSTALSFTPLINDRPAGPTQASLPVTIPVRSDYAGLLRDAQTALHDRGCVLPLVSGPLALPPASLQASAVLDPLDYIGRSLTLAASTALLDPTTDPLALVRPATTTAAFEIAARSINPAVVAVAPADYDALQLASGVSTTITLTQAPMVMLIPILHTAGFTPANPLPTPASSTSWARFVNTGGLVAGKTLLGDELRLLHSATEIAASALSGMRNWIWNGTAFAP